MAERILVTGAGGQLGRALLTAGAAAGVAIVGCTRADLDIGDAEAVRAAVHGAKPGVIVNAAAWTDVDGAEGQSEAAYRANRDGPANLAAACREAGARLVHVSTDYVFAGDGDRPLAPGDPAVPVNVYGASKSAGEEVLRATGAPAMIVRTSAVFSSSGRNFVTTMLRLGHGRDTLRVVDDQWTTPTPAAALAAALLAAATRFRPGTWHFAGAPAVTWCGFARAIFAAAAPTWQGPLPAIEAIPSSAYPTRARRPRFSALDSTAFARDFSVPAADWRDGLAAVLRDLSASSGSEPARTG